MDIIDWMDRHPMLAGWAEAFGTIGALGIAIYLPYQNKRAERRRAKARDKLAASALEPNIIIFGTRVADAILDAEAATDIVSLRRVATIEIPNELVPGTVLTSMLQQEGQAQLAAATSAVSLTNYLLTIGSDATFEITKDGVRKWLVSVPRFIDAFRLLSPY